ncbi:hypothetical protein HDU97_010318 [Phlyctochytrium planicorne]|nr:hypothetical protein HDU97_010318 [Phlyctochytrium planicorne]
MQELPEEKGILSEAEGLAPAEAKTETVDSAHPARSPAKATDLAEVAPTAHVSAKTMDSAPLSAADNGSSISEQPAVQGRDITAVPDSEPVPMSGAESHSSDRTHDKPSHMNGSMSAEQTELDKFQLKFCNKILKSSKRLKDVGPFLQPVDPIKLNIPNYFDFIKNPMDISTIQSKLDTNQYRNFSAFKSDLDLMFNNCYLFNGREAVVSKMAQSLQKYFTEKLEKLPTTLPAPAPPPLKKIKAPSQSQLESSRPKRETHIPARDLPQPALGRKGGLKKPTPELKYAANVIREIMKPKYFAMNYPFLEPVDPVKLGIPQYPLIIKNPMDLGTISKKLDLVHYNSIEECEADVRLMFENCRRFNAPGTDVYEMGRKLESLFDSKWREVKEKSLQNMVASKLKANYEKTSHQEEDSSSSEDEVSFLPENFLKIVQQVAQLASKKGKKKDKEKKLMKTHSSSSMKQKSKSKDSSKTSSHKPSKSKRSSSSGNKRKASSDEDTVKEVTWDQKRELSEKINDLSPDKLETVYEIIRRGLPHLDTQSAGQEEIELDIDSLDKATLYKLYKFVKNSTKKPPAKRQKTAPQKKPESKPASKPKDKPVPMKKSGNASSSSDSSSSSGSDSDSADEAEISDADTTGNVEPSNVSLPKPLSTEMLADTPAKEAKAIDIPAAPLTAPAIAPTVPIPSIVAAPMQKRPLPAPAKRRETIDIFNYVDVHKEKKREEMEKLQKEKMKRAMEEKEKAKEKKAETDKGIKFPTATSTDEPMRRSTANPRHQTVEEATPNLDWIEINRAGYVVHEFEESFVAEAETVDEELATEFTAERDFLVVATVDSDVVDKLSKAGVEIEVLLKEIEHSSEIKQRLKFKNEEQKEKIDHLEVQIDMKTLDRVEMTSDMSRQYKSMQAEMMARINSLEAANLDLRQKLGKAAAQTAAQEAAKEFTRVIAQKDEMIEEQNVKMSYMSTEFETMLNLKMLESFEVKGSPRIIPYLPGPKTFVTESVCRKRVKQLDDYFQDLVHLESRIAFCSHVKEFLKETPNDIRWNSSFASSLEEIRPKNLAPWSKSQRLEAKARSENDLERSQTPPQAQAQDEMLFPASSHRQVAKSAMGEATISKPLTMILKVKFNEERWTVSIRKNATLSEVLGKVIKKAQITSDGVQMGNLYIVDNGEFVLIDEDEILQNAIAAKEEIHFKTSVAG